MALADDLTLNPGSYGGVGGYDKVFNLLPPTKDGSTLRRVAATAFTSPETLAINHRESVEGGVTYDQHLVRLDNVFTDPVKGQVKVSSWHVVKVPRGTSVVTNSVIKNCVGNTINAILASGNLDKLLAGES